MVLKVCLLTSSFPRYPGDSAGVFLYHLARHLTRKGVDVLVLAPHDADYKTLESFENISIRRFRYFFPHRLQRLCYRSGILNNIKSDLMATFQIPLLFLSELVWLAQIAAFHQIDLVHAHWTFPQGLVAIAIKKLFHTPCVVTLHGSDVHGLKHPLFKRLNRMVAHQADACTANSAATRDAVSGLEHPINIHIIPMGVDPGFLTKKQTGRDTLRQSVHADGRLILYVGRLVRIKGVDRLIQAMPAVMEKHPDARLVIVGDGPEKKDLLALSQKLQLRQHTFFRAEMPQESLVEWYSAADLFVLPSRINPSGEKEGQGVVLLEAMACGLPVVASNVGGIPSIVKHEKTGMLVRPGDAADISAKICMLLEKHDLRHQIIENARHMVLEQFTWETIAESFINTYQAVIRTKA